MKQNDAKTIIHPLVPTHPKFSMRTVASKQDLQRVIRPNTARLRESPKKH